MADKKISDFTATSSAAAGDFFELETVGGNSRKITLANLAASLVGYFPKRLFSAYASVGTNVSDNTEKTLQTYTLPGGTLASDGQSIRVTVRGSYANTSRSRQLRLYFGATVVTFMSSSTGSAYNVVLEATIIRSGATTQKAFGPSMNAVNNTTTLANHFQEFNDPGETLSGDVVIKVTGQVSSGTPVANDVTCDMVLIEFLP